MVNKHLWEPCARHDHCLSGVCPCWAEWWLQRCLCCNVSICYMAWEKKDFAGIISLSISGLDDCPRWPGGPTLITSTLQSGEASLAKIREERRRRSPRDSEFDEVFMQCCRVWDKRSQWTRTGERLPEGEGCLSDGSHPGHRDLSPKIKRKWILTMMWMNLGADSSESLLTTSWHLNSSWKKPEASIERGQSRLWDSMSAYFSHYICGDF